MIFLLRSGNYVQRQVVVSGVNRGRRRRRLEYVVPDTLGLVACRDDG